MSYQPQSALEAILLVLSYEQLRLVPYDDGVGVQTVGWGHRILPGENHLRREITRETANEVFLADWEKHERAALEAVAKGPALSPLRIGAISSLCFNIGPSAFRNSSAAKAIREGNLSAVPGKMKLWNKGRVSGKLQVLRGLVIRREAEARMWERGAEIA